MKNSAFPTALAIVLLTGACSSPAGEGTGPATIEQEDLALVNTPKERYSGTLEPDGDGLKLNLCSGSAVELEGARAQGLKDRFKQLTDSLPAVPVFAMVEGVGRTDTTGGTNRVRVLVTVALEVVQGRSCDQSVVGSYGVTEESIANGSPSGKLEVRENGEYFVRLEVKNGTVLEQTGKWQLKGDVFTIDTKGITRQFKHDAQTGTLHELEPSRGPRITFQR